MSAAKAGPTKGPKLPATPWRLDPDRRDGMEWNNHILAADGGRVCFMSHGGMADNERHENAARLIAAAPTMLAALIKARSALAMLTAPDAIKSNSVAHAWTAAVAAEVAARAAIALATGGRP